MKLYERLMVITIIGIVLLFIKFHLVKDNDVVLTELQPSVPIGLLVDTPGCVLPKFEVVSSEVQHLFKSTTGKYDCGGVPQFIQSVHSKLIINKDILRKYYELDYAKCRYWIVNRQKKNLYLPDDSFFLSEPAGQSYFDSFLFLLFPKWFRDKHSAWHEKLTVNQHRLITPFDLYEMQKDLLKLAGGTTISNSMHESTGISLFKEISKTRTCNEATISPHYCACDKYEKIDKSSPKIAAASLLVISYINNRTASERHHCCEVFFQKLIEASKMAHSSFKEHFRLVLSVTPGNGIFESTVSHNSKAGTYHIESSVIRINKYGGQSHCTKRFTLKPYCVCK